MHIGKRFRTVLKWLNLYEKIVLMEKLLQKFDFYSRTFGLNLKTRPEIVRTLRMQKKFEEYSRKYLKRRGRSGMMLNLSEETLIFLTKVCIKDQERMRLNDVFAEFEARGVFLDNHSKTEIMYYYEKLNLIEKKSDSGDAQYVKRIL